MLGEGDFFKVVLDPGADKREKGVLSQIDRPAVNTGEARLCAVIGEGMRKAPS